MRDYVEELKSIGYTAKAIAKQSGLSINQIGQGFKSGTPEYAAIRNTNRRLARQYARESGMSSKQADFYRRKILNPDLTETVKNVTRKVKARYSQGVNQYFIFGEFRNAKTKEKRFAYGFTKTYKSKRKNKNKLITEAVQNARGKLGGTNWELIRIIEQGWQVYELQGTSTG